MWRFSNLSLQGKIITIVWLGVSSALLVVLINFIFADRVALRENLRDQLQVIARITAARSSAAIAFGDVRNARENLEALSQHEAIQSACIYTIDNQLFAKYERAQIARFHCPETFTQTPPANSMVVTLAIANKSLNLGNILVISDLTPITQQFARWLTLGVFMLLVASVVVIIMSRRLKASVTDPLRELTGIMEQVKDSNDLGLRAQTQSQDEIGQLSSNFNEMLDLIETSNATMENLYRDLVIKSTKAEAATIALETRNQKTKELLSSAAHDLRQPLQAMAIFLDMLQLQEASPNQQKLIEKISQAMENLRSMFSEILDVTRLEHQQYGLELQEVDLQQLVNTLQLEFSVLAENKGLYLHTQVPSIKLLTQRGILERVIRNLVSNAINYTQEGGISLEAGLTPDCLFIEVRDTGQGISEKNLSHIFEKFVQDDLNPRASTGYGLGLAIVKNFVDQLGYRISVDSQLGQGSSFRIEIPQAYPAPGNTHGEAATPSPEANQAWLNPEDADAYEHTSEFIENHIVLIDDNREIRRDLKDFLCSLGMQVSDFDGMEDAQAYFASEDYSDPDLIISDFQLAKGCTGDQVIARIRAMLGVNIPAFIVTGNHSAEVAERIKSQGLDYYLKPVSVARLKAAIREHLE